LVKSRWDEVSKIDSRFKTRRIAYGSFLHARQVFQKFLDSNDHFDRPFSFMAMKQKQRNQKKKITSTTIPASKKITTSYLRKEQP